MEHRISSTELARKLGDVLGKIRYRGDAFVVERNGEAVARISPLRTTTATSLSEALGAWSEGAGGDEEFASDLERVNRADRPWINPWGS